MKKHEQPTHRLEKMSNFFGGSNFSKLNLYEKHMDKISRIQDLKGKQCLHYKKK